MVSDVVISDVSSITIEAALLEKSLLLHIDPRSFRSDDVYQIYRGVGVCFSGADDLVHLLLNGAKFLEARERCSKKIKSSLVTIWVLLLRRWLKLFWMPLGVYELHFWCAVLDNLLREGVSSLV